jgi:Flp pilus assembly pilin Flp
MKDLKRFILDEDGGPLTEYATIIAAGVIAALAIWALFRLVAAKINEGSRWFGGE